MKKYFVAAGILALTLVLSGPVLAAEAPMPPAPPASVPGIGTNPGSSTRATPTGFRNIAWGQDFNALPDKESFELTAQDKAQKYYLKKQDNMTMDGVTLESVRYIFLSDRFIGGKVEALGKDNSARLLLFLQGRYGSGDQALANGNNYEWDFPDVKVTYNYDPNADKTTLSWITGNIADKIE